MADSASPSKGRPPQSVDETISLLAKASYVCDRALATAVYLALELDRPLLLEGEAGVGKTEVAKALSRATGRPLLRLQCYEGLDIHSAVYEWNYSRQMIELRLAEVTGEVGREALARQIFSEEFLLKRPLLQALETRDGIAPILLIDELDRADEPFEAFLLEVLSEFSISIPELGTISAENPPTVIVTSNRTREIHDALKRRCLYHWVDYPSAEREHEILAVHVPEASQALTEQVVAVVQALRAKDLFKVPGVAESIDWTQALMALDRIELDPEVVQSTLGVLLKYREDLQRMAEDGRVDALLKGL